MATEREIFRISGPNHLTSIEWDRPYHRTSVAACLVQAVYTMERDEQQNRVGRELQANHWWEFFNFSLAKTLIDQSDRSIYGAVFRYKYYQRYKSHNNPHLKGPPRYVIAFRGTILKRETWLRDVELDMRCIFDNLHRGGRFMHAIQEIQTTVARHGYEDVWLAGHSLGGGLALLAGKTMAMFGCPLEAYIFNPPISSIPLEQLVESDNLKTAIRFAMDVVKASLATDLGYDEVREEDLFMQLASWMPNLYVNQSDPICSEYIGYFTHRIRMSELGADMIERVATRYSLRGLLFGGGGSSSSYSSPQPLHYLPSASMVVNTAGMWDFKAAHGIHQWWDPRFISEFAFYQIR